MPREQPGAQYLTFVETHVFTERVTRLGLEDAVRKLQNMLLRAPEAGQLDPGTGGLRKIRMPDPERGKGKRSGARVHYLWLHHLNRIYLIFVYGKNEGDALTAGYKRVLAAAARSIRAALGETGR